MAGRGQLLPPHSLPVRLGDGHPLPPTQRVFRFFSSSPRKTSRRSSPYSASFPAANTWPLTASLPGSSCSGEKLPALLPHSQSSNFPRGVQKGKSASKVTTGDLTLGETPVLG
jgi:hypothetical protein